MRQLLLLLAAVLTAGCAPVLPVYLSGSVPSSCAQALPRGRSPCSTGAVRAE